MRNLFFFILLLTIGQSSFAQSELLAKNYADKGEYEKAVSIYEKIYQNNKNKLKVLFALVEMNQELERYDVAQKLLEDRLKSRVKRPEVIVELGYNYSLKGQDSIAQKHYNDAIAYIDERPQSAYTIGQAFDKFNLLDQAVATYERAMKNDSLLDFNIQLARIFGEQGKVGEMFGKYIDLMERRPDTRSIAQRNFSSYITDDRDNEANVILRKTLLKKIQEKPLLLYNQLLSWLFIQQKEYKKSFTQEKAIYKRSEDENITGILDLAYIALSDGAYEDSRGVVMFIIENTNGRPKLEGYQLLLKIDLETATAATYPEIEAKYATIIHDYNNDRETCLLQIDYNHFLATKVNKSDLAIANLKGLIDEKLSPKQKAKVKMELADILVINEKFNRALIYYTQIQEKFKSSILAQEARFKVAQTSYFKGDFKWSQIQLDVLKRSSSQLIANDALALSLIINDNSLEDTTQTALKKYARADLLALQNKNNKAISELNEILSNHKGESIEDEALLKQGILYEKTLQFEKAEENYKKLIQFFKEDILADEAHYRLAKLYENHMGLPEKAKELYEQIIFNYEDSIFFVESRTRFRALRGDEIE